VFGFIFLKLKFIGGKVKRISCKTRNSVTRRLIINISSYEITIIILTPCFLEYNAAKVMRVPMVWF
jgi:hypothetical protein